MRIEFTCNGRPASVEARPDMRALDLLQKSEIDCVERGYMRMAFAFRALESGDLQGGHDHLREAARIGERFHDPLLAPMARQALGRALIHLGQTTEGVALLDEDLYYPDGQIRGEVYEYGSFLCRYLKCLEPGLSSPNRIAVHRQRGPEPMHKPSTTMHGYRRLWRAEHRYDPHAGVQRLLVPGLRGRVNRSFCERAGAPCRPL